jgi:hypothetical protein
MVSRVQPWQCPLLTQILCVTLVKGVTESIELEAYHTLLLGLQNPLEHVWTRS